MVSTPSKYTRGSYGSGLIDRPRLVEKLRSVCEHRLTLISAPPGYGKTTLVAQFVGQQSAPVLWHGIEERERDVPNLFAHCLNVLEPLAPQLKHMAAPYGYGAAELAALIADALREHLHTDVIYVLDDVHLLAGAPGAEAWLRAFVTLAPSLCHLVLMSRILPDLPLADMVARREVLAIGQEELRFTPNEIYGLGCAILGTAPPNEKIEELATRLEGWPAGTVLAFHPLPPELERAILSGQSGPEALFDALATTMLDAQPSEIRQFLLASSTLSRLTPELCGQALNLPEGARLLGEVQARNLFVSRVPSGLAYHTLFRNFLQRQLFARDPDLFRELHETAAVWFQENDSLDDAFDHYLIAGQVPEAAAIAERMAHAYFAQGKFETLLDWNSRLGQANVQVPRLLHRCAIIHTDRYEYDLAANELSRAESAFAGSGDEAGLADVLLQQATLRIQRGQYQAAADQVADLARAEPDAGNIRGRALNALGIAYLQLGNTERAVQYLEEAISLYRAYADAYALSQFLQNLGVAYWRLGRPNDALACLQEVVALRRSLGGAGSLAAALVNLGYYYGHLGDYRQAAATLQEGLSTVARFPNRRIESYLLYNLGNVQRYQGAFREAAPLYLRALELLGDSEPALQSTILSNLSTLRRWEGNLADAITLAERAADVADRLNIHMEGCVARVQLIAAQALTGNAQRIAGSLEQVVQDLRERQENFALLQALALCALVALLIGDIPGAHGHLASATALAKQIGTTQPLVIEILHNPALEDFLRAHANVYRSLLRDLIASHDAQVKHTDELPSPEHSRGLTTYSLRILSLGQERVFRDGEPIDALSLRRIGRELFFYLLFVGSASWEALGLIFWPDSPTRRVRSNFHTTLHRVRQVLGENVILAHERTYSINPQIEIWCDALELDTLVQQARLLPTRDARTEDLWRRAVGFYQGDFLPTVGADWAIAQRETLRENYIEALLGLSACARARSDLRQSLDTLKRAAELEPYREDIHREIISCYAAKGDKQRVVTHLRDLKKILRRDLDAEPSQETITLVNSLLG